MFPGAFNKTASNFFVAFSECWSLNEHGLPSLLIDDQILHAPAFVGTRAVYEPVAVWDGFYVVVVFLQHSKSAAVGRWHYF